jgi:hypothetical protein
VVEPASRARRTFAAHVATRKHLSGYELMKLPAALPVLLLIVTSACSTHVHEGSPIDADPPRPAEAVDSLPVSPPEPPVLSAQA